MATLRTRRARGVRRKRWSAAPNASQGRQLGKATRENRTAPVQEGGNGSDPDQPSLGVDPLEGRHAQESGGSVRGAFGASRGRDPPGHPAEHRRPAPLQDLQGQWVSKKHVAQSQGDGEQHRAHPGDLSQQAREASPDASAGTDGGQQRIAGARGSGNDRGERHERDHLGGVVYYVHAPLS
jgi:hypothetical protein